MKYLQIIIVVIGFIRLRIKEMFMSKIFPPFTAEQIEFLNKNQKFTDKHPYTCLEHSDTSLVATAEGWVCPIAGCKYTQNWAHDFSKI